MRFSIFIALLPIVSNSFKNIITQGVTKSHPLCNYISVTTLLYLFPTAPNTYLQLRIDDCQKIHGWPKVAMDALISGSGVFVDL